MKKHLTLIVSTALMLASCASVAEYSQTAGNQRFQDGVYSRPARTAVDQTVQSEASALAEKTRGTEIYLSRGRIDTLYIPENKAAQFKYDWRDSTTTLTILDDNYYDRYAWNFGYGFGYGWGWPYRSWYGSWYSPWYSSWYWDPWYDPFWDYGWYGWGPYYYDSWAYGGWYGPWGPWGYGPRLPYHGWGYSRDAVYTPRMSTVEGSNRQVTAGGQRRNTFGENPTVRRGAAGTSSGSRSYGTRASSSGSSSGTLTPLSGAGWQHVAVHFFRPFFTSTFCSFSQALGSTSCRFFRIRYHRLSGFLLPHSFSHSSGLPPSSAIFTACFFCSSVTFVMSSLPFSSYICA